MDPFVNFRTEFPTFQHCLASQTSTCELEVRGVFDGLGKVDFCSENVTGKNFSCYRPQRSCGKVMFLHLFVILFGGGGVWQTHPSRKLPLQRTVRILLECILVSKEFDWIKIWGDSGGLSFDSGILPLLIHACGEQWLAIKRLAGVAPEVNVKECTSEVMSPEVQNGGARCLPQKIFFLIKRARCCARAEFVNMWIICTAFDQWSLCLP